MRAKSLRIGNLVECFGTREVIAIKNNKIKLQHESKHGNFIIEWVPIDSLSLKPIPLTEEWLLKFGGKPLENGYFISVTNLKAELHFELFEDTDEIVTTIKSDFCDLILDRIKYVHQLQNLYFSLTGEELTIK